MFTLLSARFSVRVQVRFGVDVRGSGFGVRGSGFDVRGGSAGVGPGFSRADPALVRRRPFDPIDDEHINGAILGVQVQAKLILECVKDRRTVRVDGGEALRIEIGPPCELLRRPLQVPFERAGQAGAIGDGRADLACE